MDERLINLFEQELRHLREGAKEFARAYPSAAPGLALEQNPPDPYVERLLEGVAFMAARVRLRLDAQFPEITQSLLESTYPDFLAPVPSMVMLKLSPLPDVPPPPEGQVYERGTQVRATLRQGDGQSRMNVAVGLGLSAAARENPEQARRAALGAQVVSPCLFSLGHTVRLLPVELVEAGFISRRLHETGADAGLGARAALRLRLRKTTPAPWAEIALDPLVVHVPPRDGLGYEIMEQLFRHQAGVLVRDGIGLEARTVGVWPEMKAQKHGFAPDCALLPVSPRTFEGYRLLREFFAMPERFLFFRLEGFGAALKHCQQPTVDVVIAFKEGAALLEREVTAAAFELFATPAINLFPKTFSRVIDPSRYAEFQVIPDANRASDFEVYSVDGVEGFSESEAQGRQFQPFFQTRHRESQSGAFFSVKRLARSAAPSEARSGRSLPYMGSDVFVSLVDSRQSPYAEDICQLVFSTRCSNRHLPVLLRDGGGDWVLDGGAKGKAAVNVLREPTVPCFKAVDGEYAWRLLSLLNLNYLSLAGEGDESGAALREILLLYASGSTQSEEWTQRLIEAIRRVSCAPISRPIQTLSSSGKLAGATALVRGLEITVNLEEASLREQSTFILGAVLDEFFSRYVSLNSFTELVIQTWPENRERMRWPHRLGSRLRI